MTLEEAVRLAIVVMEAERLRANPRFVQRYLSPDEQKAADEYRQTLLDAINVLRRAVTPRDVTP